MTSDQIQSNTEAFAADCRGEETQQQGASGAWYSKAAGTPFYSSTPYRVAPVPAARYWSKPDDIPVGPVYYRDIGNEGWSSIIAAGPRGFQVTNDRERIVVVEWSNASKGEHSTDRKTWRKCVVEGRV